jgi:hypothetical protein
VLGDPSGRRVTHRQRNQRRLAAARPCLRTNTVPLAIFLKFGRLGIGTEGALAIGKMCATWSPRQSRLFIFTTRAGLLRGLGTFR